MKNKLYQKNLYFNTFLACFAIDHILTGGGESDTKVMAESFCEKTGIKGVEFIQDRFEFVMSLNPSTFGFEDGDFDDDEEDNNED